MSTRVLLVGESWFTHTIHQKGFDSFTTSAYEEGATHFIEAVREAGFDLDYLPSHKLDEYPRTIEGLRAYDVVILSDVGANSFLLQPATFQRSEIQPNLLQVTADYVHGGGGLLMVGGYMSFSGIDGRARFGASPLADVLPVEMLGVDDRVETPEGTTPQPAGDQHPALNGVPDHWPALLGYNRVRASADAHVLATVGDDPLVVVAGFGDGRSGAFASDLAPHWAPPEFMEWSGYSPLWSGLLTWLASS